MVMSTSLQNPPAKNGKKFKVIGVARISTLHQDSKSLDDQRAYYEEWLHRTYGDEFEIHVIQSRGSGEDLQRPELKELNDLVNAGDIDLVISEDLGRIARRVDAYKFCETAADVGTRVVAVNDFIDTAQEGWKSISMLACMRHEAYNQDTSLRIRRSLCNRFKNGGVVQSLPYGYSKPHAHAHEIECTKLQEAEPVYDEIFRRLEEGQTFATVADWMNEQGIPTGPACKASVWNGPLLAKVVRNPILKGLRQRNRRISKRVNRTGKRRTEPAPPDMRIDRYVPHLAFIEAERYDRVIQLLARRGEKYKRAEGIRNDPRAGIPRKQTRWPGQHLLCGVCGRLYVWGGHGRSDRLMCNGAREHLCWNAMTVDGPTVSRAVADEVRRQIEEMTDFDAVWLQQLQVEAAAIRGENDRARQLLENDLIKVQRELKNLVDFIGSGYGKSESVSKRLCDAENQQTDIRNAIFALERQTPCEVNLPPAKELRKVARDAFAELAIESQDFGNLMRTIIDDLYVLPYRIIGGGHPQPRCQFKLNLSTLLPDIDPRVLRKYPSLNVQCTADLTSPPQYDRIRKDVVRMRCEGMTEKEIAGQLNVTITAVQHAASLQRQLDTLGLETAWERVLNGEAVQKTFKRVHHDRYQFQPLPGFAPPPP